MTVSPPVLSVVIATAQPWPAIRIALESVMPQARAVGAEIIIADGSDGGLPADFRATDVVVLRELGASVFRLRAVASAQARGEFVAMTEDHCRVLPGWCEGVIRAHREYPQAAAIGGVVENGATEHLVDWASFFVSNAYSMAPVRSGEAQSLSGQANLSYKRRVVIQDVPARGVMEFLHLRSLRDRGDVLVTDDRLIVEHVQCVDFVATSVMHFHNGRSIAGFLAEGMQTPARLLRAVLCLLRPPVEVLRRARVLLRKRRFLKEAIASSPCIVWFLLCQLSGECSGYLLGAGSSPQRVP